MKAKITAKLDPEFLPLSVVCREMAELTKENGQDIIIAAIRNNGYATAYKTRFFPEGNGQSYINTLLKEICL